MKDITRGASAGDRLIGTQDKRPRAAKSGSVPDENRRRIRNSIARHRQNPLGNRGIAREGVSCAEGPGSGTILDQGNIRAGDDAFNGACGSGIPVSVRVSAPENRKVPVLFKMRVLLLTTSMVPPPDPMFVFRPRVPVSLLNRSVPPSRTTCPPLLLRLPRLGEPNPLVFACP